LDVAEPIAESAVSFPEEIVKVADWDTTVIKEISRRLDVRLRCAAFRSSEQGAHVLIAQSLITVRPLGASMKRSITNIRNTRKQ
jgi:hypothetical protein